MTTFAWTYARDDIEVLQHLLTVGLEFFAAGNFEEADIIFRMVSTRLNFLFEGVD